MSSPIIEHAYLTMKPGGGSVYVRMFPDFREILMSHPGAISLRLLKHQEKPETFCCRMEWESKDTKNQFIADPRLKPWAEEFFKYVDHETIDYFDEVG